MRSQFSTLVVVTLFVSACLTACSPNDKFKNLSPRVGTYSATVEDRFMAEFTLRSDGMFSYTRAGKDIYDRAYGQWEQKDKEIILRAVKRYPNTWGGPVLTLVQNGEAFETVIDDVDVSFEQTDSFKDSLRKSDELRERVLAR